MQKGPKEQVVTNRLDPGMEAQRQKVFDRANQVANQPYSGYGGQTVAGASGSSIDAARQMGGMAGQFGGIQDRFGPGFGLGLGQGPNTNPYTQAGATGARALSGDMDATNQLMNPYMRNVIDAMGGEYDQLRGKAMMGANSAATGAGAFGGSRHAVMAGERLGALDRGQASDISNLLHGGFNDAMGRAGAAANLGMGANDLISRHQLGMGGLQLGAGGLQLDAARGQMDALGQQFGMGDYFRGINQAGLDSKRKQFEEQRDWGLRGMDVLNSTMGAPGGGSTQQPLYRNPWSAGLGGAATGFGIGGPVGAAVGGIGGLLFG